MRVRRWQRHGRPNSWPALGLAGAIMFLAGCGLTQTPGGASGGSGTPASGHVNVATDKLQYSPSETVSVTITNNLSSGIVAADHQSNCTVLVIERLDGQTWQPQNPCRLMTPTRLIPFAAGSTTPVQLLPPSAAGAHGWPTGTYRIAFTYRQQPNATSAASASGPGTTVYSAQFTIT